MKIKQIRENSTEELVSQIKENERKMLEMKVRKAAADENFKKVESFF